MAVTGLDEIPWDVPRYLQAWEQGLFGKNTELIEGEVRRVSHGRWHGRTQMQLAIRLGEVYPESMWDITTETLLLPNNDRSAPDPDAWVMLSNVEPIEVVGRMARYNMAHVQLVVEVSDSSLDEDLNLKARMYASAGIAEYWVVSKHGIYVHGRPNTFGYANRNVHMEWVTAPGADANIRVRDIIG